MAQDQTPARVVSTENKVTLEQWRALLAVIDAGGPDSIYLHYGIWDDAMYRLKKGRFWGWAKDAHDALWRTQHR